MVVPNLSVLPLILMYSNRCRIKKQPVCLLLPRKILRWILRACAHWRMLHCLPCGSRVDRLAPRRLLKQKGQAAEIISGLVPRPEEFAEWLRRNLRIPDQECVDSLMSL